MKFGLIEPKRKRCGIVEADNIRDLYDRFPGKVDHGSINRHLGFIVHEFGFFVPKEEQHYCSINRQLIAGTAILYQYDEIGETVDFTNKKIFDNVWFYQDWQEAEASIADGVVRRPEISVNGGIFWQWPQEQPDWMKRDD